MRDDVPVMTTPNAPEKWSQASGGSEGVATKGVGGKSKASGGKHLRQAGAGVSCCAQGAGSIGARASVIGD